MYTSSVLRWEPVDLGDRTVWIGFAGDKPVEAYLWFWAFCKTCGAKNRVTRPDPHWRCSDCD